MLYSRLGSSGLIVSRLSLGTMTFTQGGGNGAIAKTHPDEAKAILHRALDAGINFFDTANVYADGESETLFGELVRGLRDEVIVATKAGWRTGSGLNDWGLSASHLHRAIDASLKRLGTDHVDVYIAHRQDDVTPLEEQLQALDAIVRAGKARYLGFSNWAAWKVAAALELQRANGWAPFTHGQMMYSLLGREIEHEVLPMAKAYELGLTAWSPLAGGFLSGKYGRDRGERAEDRLAQTDFMAVDWELGYDLIERMRTMAAAHGASVAQVAIAWLLAKEQVSSVVLGASKLGQLEDNIAAAELALSPDEIAELDAKSAIAPRYPITVADRKDDAAARALAARPGDGYRPATFGREF